ncbi:acetyl-CoA carboxylase biotin carboxyl carrier protein [Deinococcus psychrotolerans]|uniref:Biotin carboxyl carrier protein of acetyl-CoA carboxylase n=1 Tax=Deinococcus psychrotolerans TaxID=2489213 RepID=A0A3G8Y8C4_9DEIO|nr:acetyl-CoA carboxylase biotin carboxyl carrier protein [Deinococcus psychrotolerans]AZI41618.1 acetyl-CoA carboxylase biotin carboxyl carrier protein [Deinococcus psychrotolerans]
MNPDDLKKILDALSQADVREFALKTGEFDLSLRRGPQAMSGASTNLPAASAAPQSAAPAPSAAPVAAESPAVSTASASAPAAAPEAAPVPAKAAAVGTPLKAPIVGTFYASSSPDAAAYVKVGDTVAAGQILCIIEAMKLMNEIEAETGGVVREILVKNAEPVEYGQTLFLIE